MQFFLEKKRIATIIILFLVSAGIAFATFNTFSKKEEKKEQPPEQEIVTQEEPTIAPRQWDGRMVAVKKRKQFPYCVMIENAAFDGVRPQSGLGSATIVYEIIVEGGITRFMAIFSDTIPDTIGPVRSARDNFLDVAAEYHCPYFHAGGSDTAIARIPKMKLRSVNGLIEYQYFFRDPFKYAPHDFFITRKNLKTAVKNHNWFFEPWPDVVQWEHVQEKDLANFLEKAQKKKGESLSIGFDFGYDVAWKYNAKKGVYTRMNAGVPHVDALTEKQLSASNVIVQYVDDGTLLPDKGRVNWPMTGEGKAHIFHHGYLFEGTWKKKSPKSRTLFFDETGEQIPLAVGNTWVEIVPPHVIVKRNISL